MLDSILSSVPQGSTTERLAPDGRIRHNFSVTSSGLVSGGVRLTWLVILGLVIWTFRQDRRLKTLEEQVRALANARSAYSPPQAVRTPEPEPPPAPTPEPRVAPEPTPEPLPEYRPARLKPSPIVEQILSRASARPSRSSRRCRRPRRRRSPLLRHRRDGVQAHAAQAGSEPPPLHPRPPPRPPRPPAPSITWAQASTWLAENGLAWLGGGAWPWAACWWWSTPPSAGSSPRPCASAARPCWAC